MDPLMVWLIGIPLSLAVGILVERCAKGGHIGRGDGMLFVMAAVVWPILVPGLALAWLLCGAGRLVEALAGLGRHDE